MTGGKAKSLVIASVGAAGVLSSLEYLADGKRPPLTVFVGMTVTGVVLLAAADLSPDVAGGLALLLLVGAVLRNGTAAAKTLSTTLDRK